MSAAAGRRVRGFTLLELLVALAIFTIIAVAAYMALFAVLDTRDQTRAASRRLAAVQYALTALSADLRQAVDRPVRSLQPRRRGALYAPGGEVTPLLTLTRGGWPNPARLQRSTLARVRWRLVDGALERSVAPRIDAPATLKPQWRRLLSQVDGVELRFRAAGDAEDDRWHKRWPPLNTPPDQAGLPRAIKVTVDLADWGKVRRLIALPAGPSARPRTSTQQQQN